MHRNTKQTHTHRKKKKLFFFCFLTPPHQKSLSFSKITQTKSTQTIHPSIHHPNTNRDLSLFCLQSSRTNNGPAGPNLHGNLCCNEKQKQQRKQSKDVISQIPFCNLPNISPFFSLFISKFLSSLLFNPPHHYLFSFSFPCSSSFSSSSSSPLFFFRFGGFQISLCFFGVLDISGSVVEMLKRKMKGVSIESSSSPFSYDEESRNRFSNQHQSLIQDFNQLQKETDAIRKKLHRDKQRKHTLLAEVRFLRRRYKFLMRNQSPNTVTPRVERDLVRSQAPVSRNESYRLPKRSPVLDLNKISNGEDEVGDDYYVSHRQEPPMRMEKKPRSCARKVEKQQQQQQQQHQQQYPSDANMLVCREVMNASSRPGKRKISWQDQVALKV